MTSDATSAVPPAQDSLSFSRIARLAAIVFLGVLPVFVLIALFASTIHDDVVAMDFRQFYRAGEAILRGESPYLPSGEPLTPWGGPYPYPPLPAQLTSPLTLLPLDAAAILVMASLVVVALAVPFVAGVRDWRCYGLMLLWPPVISAIQTGNLTLWLALACALAWRFRASAPVTSVSLGLSLAVKLFLWPLVIWLAATRRFLSAVLATVVGLALLVLSWAVLGFAGFLDYPDLLRRLEEVVGDDSYTAYIVALDAGLPAGVARAIWLTLGIGLLAAVVVVARRGDERTSFALAITAALALSPIVWLHYFALLLVVVALAQPRLGVVWFVPLGMVVTPGSGHPTPFETAWTLGVAALTVALATRELTKLRSRGGEGALLAPAAVQA